MCFIKKFNHRKKTFWLYINTNIDEYLSRLRYIRQVIFKLALWYFCYLSGWCIEMGYFATILKANT